MKKYSPTNLNRSLFLQTQIFFILEIKKYDINEKHINQEKLGNLVLKNDKLFWFSLNINLL